MKVSDIEKYLRTDSTHTYDQSAFKFVVLDDCTFSINDQIVFLLGERDAALLDWPKYDINYVIDATGVYLTTSKAQAHNVDYVIMCAPPKDTNITPQFVVNGNHEKYAGEAIVSNASCTTNCIVPVLRALLDNYDLKTSSFTTIHAATASQNVIDTNRFDERTCRSVLGNIIPHKTGASKSVANVLPDMKGKITGTSLRVPVQNVSIVDLNVQLSRTPSDSRAGPITLNEIYDTFETTSSKYLSWAQGKNLETPSAAAGSRSAKPKSEHSEVPVIQVENRSLVSCDFNTSLCPSIVDGT